MVSTQAEHIKLHTDKFYRLYNIHSSNIHVPVRCNIFIICSREIYMLPIRDKIIRISSKITYILSIRSSL
jgi:hypothetical protein